MRILEHALVEVEGLAVEGGEAEVLDDGALAGAVGAGYSVRSLGSPTPFPPVPQAASRRKAARAPGKRKYISSLLQSIREPGQEGEADALVGHDDGPVLGDLAFAEDGPLPLGDLGPVEEAGV